MAKKATKKVSDEAAVLEKIAALPEPFRAMGERLHTLILRSAPTLQPKTWYGMPAYCKVICFFRADKYMTFGLSDNATFERAEGVAHQLLGSSWFFEALDEATEAELAAIVQMAAS